MFPAWRKTLREANLALRGGRYDEAGELLAGEDVRDFRQARRLATDVAARLVERAGERMASGDSLAGWHDLDAADRLGGCEQEVRRAKGAYAAHVLAEARRLLAAGDSHSALEQLNKLHRRGHASRAADRLMQIASHMNEAADAAAQGHFSQAGEKLTRARLLAAEEGTITGAEAPDTSTADTAGGGTLRAIAGQIDSQLAQFEKHQQCSQQLSIQLHAALANQQWGEVLTAAEELLSISPQHATARQARQRAWKAVGMDATQANLSRPAARSMSLLGNGAGQANAAALYNRTGLRNGAGRPDFHSTRAKARTSEGDTVTGHTPPERMMMWIDAVGGFLLCMDQEVVLGQPSPDRPIAVPILADLSRRHAVLRRDGGAYVLEPVQLTLIDGRPLSGPTVLESGQLIQLGDSVRVRFRRPHALSSTALLTIESHHKTQPSADAVLLMADSCVLGPNKHCHVQCPAWKSDVVLFRQAGGWKCRSAGPVQVEGREYTGLAPFSPGMRVEGDEFSLYLEEVETSA